MKVYEQKQNPPFKWILAGVLFIVVLGVTWDEVNGVVLPSYPSGSTYNHSSGCNYGSGDSSPDCGSNPRYDPPTIPPYDGDRGGDNGGDCGNGNQNPVPEPSTLILLASGLSAGFASRLRKK